MSANVSYQDAALDIKYLTGVTVPSKTQHRLVHYQDFREPISTEDISELSADGEKVRLRAAQGEKSEWKDYKAIVSETGIIASFNQNDIIINWAN
ncbi:ISKra4 family transposase, partial [Microcoleus sp. F8_C2]